MSPPKYGGVGRIRRLMPYPASARSLPVSASARSDNSRVTKSPVRQRILHLLYVVYFAGVFIAASVLCHCLGRSVRQKFHKNQRWIQDVGMRPPSASVIVSDRLTSAHIKNIHARNCTTGKINCKVRRSVSAFGRRPLFPSTISGSDSDQNDR